MMNQMKRRVKYSVLTVALSCVMPLTSAGDVASVDSHRPSICADFKSRNANQMFATPQDPLDLLKRIRIAKQNGTFFDDSFYTEETLKGFFGGKKITWREESSTKKSLFVSDFDGLVTDVKTDQYRVDGLGVSLVKVIREDKSTRVQLGLTIRGDEHIRLSFENIADILGNDWETDRDIDRARYWHHGGYREPTHPHGNDFIKYKSVTSEGSCEVSLQFAFDGGLRMLDLTEIKNPF